MFQTILLASGGPASIQPPSSRTNYSDKWVLPGIPISVSRYRNITAVTQTSGRGNRLFPGLVCWLLPLLIPTIHSHHRFHGILVAVVLVGCF